MCSLFIQLKNSSFSLVGRRVCIFVFLGCMINLCVGVCFVLPLTVESFSFMFGAGVTNLSEPPSSFFLNPIRVRSWLHPYKSHSKQKAMRDEGVIYVACHPLLNWRYTRLPGCIHLWNDLYCVESGVKLYSLHRNKSFITQHGSAGEF